MPRYNGHQNVDFQMKHTKILGIVILLPLLLSACALFTSYDDSAPPPPVALAVCETAKAQVGKPYRPGGTTAKGFDCSGLAFYCYGKNGISLPRTSSDQADAGRKVSEKNIREGDRLIFKPGFFSSHTGIYIGNGKFIHAPGRGRSVEECSLNDEHWRDMLSQVRRVIPDAADPEKK